MSSYINPIPYIDMGKEFEIRLSLHFEELLDVDKAKDIAADYILGLSKEDLKKVLSCKTYPVYPDSKFNEPK